MKYKKMLAGLLAALTLSGCSVAQPAFKADNLTKNISVQQVAAQEPDDAFTDASYAFSLKLLQEIAKKKPGENILISPGSVTEALAMTANGAAGTTQEQILTGLGGLPLDTLNAELLGWRNSLAENKQLRSANSLWIRKDDSSDLQVKPDFLQTVTNYFKASAMYAPFDESTVKDINNWCKKNTDGMIPELLNEIPSGAMMYLVNAVCFDAKWETPPAEDEIHDSSFTTANGTLQTVQMMNTEESGHLRDDKAEGFWKYYTGQRFAFAALLPEEGLTPEEYLAQIDPAGLKEVLLKHGGKVKTGIPEFTVDFDIDLKEPLKEMGMTAAFSGGCNLSGLAENAEDLCISRVLHKTHMELDRNGTKAAAVTASEVSACDAVEETPIPVVILNRPFICAILDTETGTPVFLAIINQMQ